MCIIFMFFFLLIAFSSSTLQVTFLLVNTVRFFCDAPSLTPVSYNFLQLQVQSFITNEHVKCFSPGWMIFLVYSK